MKHTGSLVVAALVAAVSLASAEPENRPKIYFPRHVKRQYTNHTITSSASPSTQSGLADSTSHSSTKKDTISDLLSSLLGGTPEGDESTSSSSSATSATSSISAVSTSESESDESVGSTGGVPPLLALPTLSLDLPSLLPTSDADSTVSSNGTATATGSATETTGDVLTTGESASNGTATESASVPSTSSGILIAPTGVVTQSSSGVGGVTSVVGGATSAVGGVTSAVGDVTSAVLPSPTANATDSTTGSSTDASSGTSTDTDSGLLPTILPSLLPSSLSLFPTTSFPGTAPTTSTSSTGPSSSSVVIPTSVANTTESGLLPTISVSLSLPNTTASPTEAYTTPVSSPTLPTAPSTSSIVTVPLNTTAPATTTAESTTSSKSTVSSTAYLTSIPTSTSSSTTAPAFTSIPVIGTITNSQSWLPTTIIVQPSTSISTGGQSTAITPWTEPPEQPQDSTLIQISEPLAASQMFDLLPQGLAYGGGYDAKRVVMYSIRPYDTTARLGYITSQAMVYYPTEGISQLSDDIGYPTTAFQINPAIGIMPGSFGGDPADTGSANNGDPFDTQGPGEQTTSAQQGMTAGIAVGAASVAGAYGAAMFIIARRYKRKKQRHQRSSSVNSPSEMRQAGSPALMGGALLSRDFTSNPGYGGAVGNTRDSQGSGRSGMNSSARTANISAPVAAENSLGWN
ncbi:hypothetical protein F4804DRAFT_343356 [Jackrogersella minutella]|nr:hypothetical protein F4804DRAFT_343356 [Jackrogersella minutella]